MSDLMLVLRSTKLRRPLFCTAALRRTCQTTAKPCEFVANDSKNHLQRSFVRVTSWSASSLDGLLISILPRNPYFERGRTPRTCSVACPPVTMTHKYLEHTRTRSTVACNPHAPYTTAWARVSWASSGRSPRRREQEYRHPNVIPPLIVSYLRGRQCNNADAILEMTGATTGSKGAMWKTRCCGR